MLAPLMNLQGIQESTNTRPPLMDLQGIQETTNTWPPLMDLQGIQETTNVGSSNGPSGYTGNH